MHAKKTERLSESQIQDLWTLYQSEWWTKGREMADVRCMLEHSDIIIGLCEPATKRLVAFARVLTDYVYKALIFDVIVDAPHRGSGLGQALLDAIVGHPELQRVRHWELYCLPELIPFYERWGFTEDLGGLRFMRRTGG